MKNFYRDGGLVISVSALVIALVIIQGYIYTKDINVFWLSAPFVVLIGGFAIGKLIQVTRKTFQYYARIDDELESKMHMSVHSFPMSAVIIDSAGRIVWTNGKFTEEFPDCCEYGMELSDITDIPPADFFTDDALFFLYGLCRKVRAAHGLQQNFEAVIKLVGAGKQIRGFGERGKRIGFGPCFCIPLKCVLAVLAFKQLVL